jgi:Uma2 family endonuclease
MIILIAASPIKTVRKTPVASKRKKPYTIEDLDRVQQETGKNFHLVDGNLIEIMPAGLYHGIIGARVGTLFSSYIYEHDLGESFAAETGFKLPQPNTVIAPDFAFIAKARLPKDMKKKGYGDVVPDFVVEVKSPNDTTKEILEKVALWLEAGVKLGWVVNPEKETVTTYTVDEITHYKNGDTVTVEPVIRGFSKKLSAFFK